MLDTPQYHVNSLKTSILLTLKMCWFYFLKWYYYIIFSINLLILTLNFIDDRPRLAITNFCSSGKLYYTYSHWISWHSAHRHPLWHLFRRGATLLVIFIVSNSVIRCGMSHSPHSVWHLFIENFIFLRSNRMAICKYGTVHEQSLLKGYLWSFYIYIWYTRNRTPCT